MKYVQVFKHKSAGYVLLILYFLVALFIFKDYGISWDEPVQRRHSLASYKQILGERLNRSDVPDTVKRALDVPESGKYYGVALQLITVAIEHMNNFEMDISSVYYMRHFFTFFNYWLACLCFYLLLRRRYEDSYLPFLGLLMLVLYPRFFSDSFYNIKDMLFASWYLISSYFALEYLRRPSVKNLVLFALTSAICTNTRIMGASILLLVMAIAAFKAYADKETSKRKIYLVIMLPILFFMFYTIITPTSWDNPVKFFIVASKRFSAFNHRTIQLYLGEFIDNHVPWHYIPIWIVITTPVIYTVLFFMGTITKIVTIFKSLFKDKAFLNNASCFFEETNNIYDFFMLAAFWCTLLAMIFLRVSLYDTWRHVYFLFIPFLYLSVQGLYLLPDLFKRLADKKLLYRCLQGITYGLLGVTLLFTGIWIAKNHPYQQVYFNTFVRSSVVKNFDREYWCVSHRDLYKYVLATDDRKKITIDSRIFNITVRGLPKESRGRLSRKDVSYGPDYYVCRFNNNTTNDYEIAGYEEIQYISVDGFKISSLFKYVINDTHFSDFKGNVENISSSITDSKTNRIIDNNSKSRWTTGRAQGVGDNLIVQFNKPVDYNLLRLKTKDNDYPRKLNIFTSDDGATWRNSEIIWHNRTDYVIKDASYKYLKIENAKADEKYWWSIYELNLGNIDEDEILSTIDKTGLFKYIASDSKKDIKNITSNISKSKTENCTDNDMDTRWTTGRAQKSGDNLITEFNKSVDYNLFRLQIPSESNDYPRELKIFISDDGVKWKEAKLVCNNKEYYVIPQDLSYKYLKLENAKKDNTYYWSIYELKFGKIDKNEALDVLYE